jgi:thymidylate synthase
MFYVKADDFSEIFLASRNVLINSIIVKIKDSKTREVLNACFELTNPRSRFIYHPERKFNVAFNIAEMFSHISGINSVEYFKFWNSNYSQFSDNGINFHGNYGERLKNYLPLLIDKLKNDKGTRQAVLNIYNSNDMCFETKDTPCTLVLDFKIRNNKLNLTVVMRSNDLIWGLMYDLPAFTMIQEIIANSVNVGLGSYTHFATSLHVYERHWGLLDKMEVLQKVIMPKINYDYSEALSKAKEVEKMSFVENYFPIENNDHLISALNYYKMRKLKTHYLKDEHFPDYVVKLYS